jgi:hypothetical protein
VISRCGDNPDSHSFRAQDVEVSPGNKPAFIGVVPLRASATPDGTNVKGFVTAGDKEGTGLEVVKFPRDSDGDGAETKMSADDMYDCELQRAKSCALFRAELLSARGLW